MVSFLLTCATPWWFLIAVGRLLGETGSAVDACRDAAARVRRAERAPDGGVLYAQYALLVSPRALLINAQHVGPIGPLSSPQRLATKEITSRHTVRYRMVNR